MKNEKVLIGIIAILVIVILGMAVSYRSFLDEYEVVKVNYDLAKENIEEVKTANRELLDEVGHNKELMDELKADLADLKEALSLKEGELLTEPIFDDVALRELERAGYQGGVDGLVEDLMGRPELIPFDPVLGGTMYFSRVVPLNHRWVYATAEDGHVFGEMLFSYEINTTGDIEWTLMDEWLAGE